MKKSEKKWLVQTGRPMKVFAASTLATAIAVSIYSTVAAAQWDVEFVNTLTYGVMMRTESPNEAAIVPKDPGSTDNPNYLFDTAQAVRAANANDGNQNFKKNDIVQNRISIISDLTIRNGDFGVFVRGRAWYDDMYQNKELYSWSENVGVISPYGDFNGDQMGQFQPESKDYLSSEIELLDAYVFTSFEVLGKFANLKVGRQVINWGESLAFSNSIAASINPYDANAATRAGIELKEIYQPTESVYGQIGLTNKISMEGFYQWKYRGTELIPTGAFFSEQDMLGAGGKQMIIAQSEKYSIDDQRDNVSDSGQYGLAFRYFTDSGTEYGIYAINAHDKTPSLETFRTNATLELINIPALGEDPADSVAVKEGQGYYVVDYKEDVKTFGASFSSVIGNTNVSGEILYRPNETVILDANCIAITIDQSLVGGGEMEAVDDPRSCNDHGPSEISEAKYAQAQVSFIHLFSENALWDALTLTGEAVSWMYRDIVNGDHDDEQSLYVTNTPTGFGSLMIADIQYNNVFWGANLNLPMTWQHGWAGTNLRTNSREGASIYSVGAQLTFPSDWQTGISYTVYQGEDKDQFDKNFYYLSDRDNIAFNVKYNF